MTALGPTPGARKGPCVVCSERTADELQRLAEGGGDARAVGGLDPQGDGEPWLVELARVERQGSVERTRPATVWTP